MSKREDFTTKDTEDTKPASWWRQLLELAFLCGLVFSSSYYGAEFGSEAVLRALDAAVDSCGGRA